MKKVALIGGLSLIILLYLYYIHEHLGAGGTVLALIFLAMIFLPKDNNNKPNNLA